jgi:hypothetical protein
VRTGNKEQVEKGRMLARLNFQYSNIWNGNFYPIKQVAPIFLLKKKKK